MDQIETAASRASVHDIVIPPLQLPLDQIICGDNCEVMRTLPSESIDLVVTSPPYDDLRTYGGHAWDFYGVAWNLKRLLKPGGIIVWVVGDKTKDGSETGSSFTQANHFKSIGLSLYDTMIYKKANSLPLTHRRYEQDFEYMFVLCKGTSPAVFNPLKTEIKYPRNRQLKIRDGDGRKQSIQKSGTHRIIGNVWEYKVGGGHIGDRLAHQHPAPFPEALARDHILSWSNEGDVVLDPFSGSGTTAKMAYENNRRYIGIEVNPEYVQISKKRLEDASLF